MLRPPVGLLAYAMSIVKAASNIEADIESEKLIAMVGTMSLRIPQIREGALPLEGQEYPSVIVGAVVIKVLEEGLEDALAVLGLPEK